MRIVVTGAARGLGAALAAEFQSTRHQVLGFDRDWRDCPQDTTHRNVGKRHETALNKNLRADLANDDAAISAVDTIQAGGPVDVVIHNAGINATGPFERLDQATMQRILAVNLRAPIVMTNTLLKRELVSEGGVLVFVGSLSSYLSYPGAAVYAASKDGLLAYARNLAPSLARRQVSCLCVLPGPLRTDHARLHAPPGAKEGGRLEPTVAAKEIYEAVQKKRKTLVPGWRAKLLGGVGLAAPRLAERMMHRLLYLPLRAEATRRVAGRSVRPKDS